jgi:hypothetical protein
MSEPTTFAGWQRLNRGVEQVTELGVLVPTRSRPQNLERLVRAWHETGAFGGADLILGIDVDDARFGGYVDFLRAHPEVRVIQLDKWAPLVPKLNLMATMSAGRYPLLAFMGDDHIPRTPMWAHMLIADHLRPGSGIVYGRDGIQDRRLPTWWSMDGRIIDALGRMVPAPVQHLYCDNAVKKLGERADQLGYDDRILIEHMHPVAGKAEMDAQYVRVNRRQQYDRDQAAFDSWVASGLEQDATLLADIWG